MSKYAKKTDATQGIVVKILRARGFQVHLLHALGEGWPDLLACRAGYCYWIEVKNPKAYKVDGSEGANTFTDAQKKFYSNWQGSKIHVIKSEQEAMDFMG